LGNQHQGGTVTPQRQGRAAVSKDQFAKLDELKKAMPKCNVRVITPLEE
jgi:hypothetical protein